MLQSYRIEIKWSVIFTLALMAWTGLERLLGWHDELIAQHAANTMWFALIATALYVLALLDKRKNHYGGQMTWLQGFLSGVWISVSVAVLTPLSQWITHTFISPDYFPNIIAHGVATGQMTQVEAEAYFTLGNYIWMSALFALGSGLITAAIVALFVRRKPQATEQAPTA